MPRRRTSRAERELRVAERVRAERDEEMRVKPLYLRSGEKNPIEEDAERLLAAGRRKAESTEKNDYLSREQLTLRRNKEVYSNNGSPDASLVSGMYKRTYNPEFGARPGRTRSSDE